MKIQAMVHSKNDKDEVEIVSENGYNDVVARYNDKLYTAIYNPFSCLYYVDDVYGEIKEQTHERG